MYQTSNLMQKKNSKTITNINFFYTKICHHHLEIEFKTTHLCKTKISRNYKVYILSIIIYFYPTPNTTKCTNNCTINLYWFFFFFKWIVLFWMVFFLLFFFCCFFLLNWQRFIQNNVYHLSITGTILSIKINQLNWFLSIIKKNIVSQLQFYGWSANQIVKQMLLVIWLWLANRVHSIFLRVCEDEYLVLCTKQNWWICEVILVF